MRNCPGEFTDGKCLAVCLGREISRGSGVGGGPFMEKYSGKCLADYLRGRPDPHAGLQVSMYSSYDLCHPG